MSPYQVQLLVSKKEKENYQHIKNYLDKLKGLVDEAELWVMKVGEGQEKVAIHFVYLCIYVVAIET